jgi:hypothetical protein
VLRVCETAMTTKVKREFVKKMHNTNAEGFVCKNRNAVYASGPALQVQVRGHGILYRWPETRQENGRRSPLHRRVSHGRESSARFWYRDCPVKAFGTVLVQPRFFEAVWIGAKLESALESRVHFMSGRSAAW